MLNELKKFAKDIYIRVLIVVVIVVSIVVSIQCIQNFYAMKSGKFNGVQGRAAISLIKERYENSKGILTSDKLNEALKYYKSMPEGDTAYTETGIKYPGILELMENVYVSDYTKQDAIFRKLSNMNDFYNRNITLITKNLNDSKNTYEPWEKNIILEKAKAIDKPFIMDFSEQWVFVYQCFMVCFIIIAVSAIVVGARLFSYEKDNKIDILSDSLGDKELRKIGRGKIKALLIFLTSEVLVGVLIISIIMFSNTGISAWNSQIQIEYFTSIYHLTFVQGYLLIILTGWISILAIGMFTAMLNAFTQKFYTSLVLGFIITFIPMIVGRLNAFPAIITKFFKMQPINAVSIIGNLESLQVFNFLFTHTLTMTAIIINSTIILGICIFISPGLFSSKIKNA
ncbi:membrane protein [Clostridium botulinum]|uniref:membrane protein n=1 Tax=Clostridium botulinum TaxID=1491 RepID=UPI0004D54B0B|nr:membrane protein [Clostridium botulinum]KEH96912.1 membrane protein [Clostridium botulinum D str. 16868]KOC31616.1 hypothetical protein ADU81_13170 [Clostridium botulinum]